jgi:hypothetical protein
MHDASAFLAERSEMRERLQKVDDAMSLFHAERMAEGMARARAAGVPERELQAYTRTIDSEWATAQECCRLSASRNLHRDLMRRFKAWFLGRHPVCDRCHHRPAIYVQHVIVTGGDPDKMYNEDLCRGRCGNCHSGAHYMSPGDAA